MTAKTNMRSMAPVARDESSIVMHRGLESDGFDAVGGTLAGVSMSRTIRQCSKLQRDAIRPRSDWGTSWGCVPSAVLRIPMVSGAAAAAGAAAVAAGSTSDDGNGARPRRNASTLSSIAKCVSSLARTFSVV